MREALKAKVAALIDRLADGSRDDAARDALLEEIAGYQASRVAPYRRLRAHGAGRALPTDVFRFARVASFEPRDEIRSFLTSGTTQGARGAHPFRDLSLYDRAARAAARHALFFDVDEPIRLVVLAPHPDEAPESSLSYMLGRFERWFGGPTTWAWRNGPDLAALEAALREAERAAERVAVLGTSFALVHAEDGLGATRFALPDGSRLMQTGGFKGRSREVAPAALREALAARYGLPTSRVVSEYGMTELSSQLYEPALRDAAEGRPPRRRYWVPGWVRARVVDPDSLEDTEGVGVLRIDDCANLDSVAAIQTSDLALIHSDGVELIGRVPGATPRGCSLAVEEALG